MRYEAQKRKRLKRHFWAVTNFEGYHYVDELQRWMTLDEKYAKEAELKIAGGFDCSSHFYPIKTVRAFKRRMKQWSKYLPAGLEFILVSHYVGYNVYLKTKK
jgi:hypothetical protein